MLSDFIVIKRSAVRGSHPVTYPREFMGGTLKKGGTVLLEYVLNMFKHYNIPSAELHDGSCNTEWSRQGCKGCGKHIPILCRGLQKSFHANGNAELVTRSSHQEGIVSPSPSQWSGSVMQNKRLRYPHHSSLLPCPTALAARGCWGLLREGCFRDNKIFCRSLITLSLTWHWCLKCAQSIY